MNHILRLLSTLSIDYQQLRTKQEHAGMIQLFVTELAKYMMQPFGNTVLVCYRPVGTHNFRILVPDNVLSHLVAWYYTVLGHTGESNL